MRKLPNHAKIQGIITACLPQGLLQMHEGEGSWAARLLTPTWSTLGCGDSTHSSCSALPSSVLSGKYVLGCARQHVTCGLRSLSIWHPGHGRHAKRRLRPPPCCSWCVIGFVVRCSVCVPIVDVAMYVCGAAGHACCGVPQRRHNFDAFFKRFGKHQPQVLVRHWIRTATRSGVSDYGVCRHLRVPRQCRSRLNSKLQKCQKETPTSEGLAGRKRVTNPPKEPRSVFL